MAIRFPKSNCSGLSCCCRCGIPGGAEFSTAINRFQAQINHQVVSALKRHRCICIPPSPPCPSILSETSHSINLSGSLTFSVSALTVLSVETTIQNLSFEIIGFRPFTVRVAGEAKLVITYSGTDLDNYHEDLIIPFSFTKTIPGDYPPNVTVTGNVVINQQIVTMREDPCMISIDGLSVQLLMTANIQIVQPCESRNRDC
ncbi:MAG TPA: hypothetical protein VHY08_07475 [Bacillota bacterium]|nr:hypothetical protein [Bacillota bacterium]